jgi:VCBS repeat-containing protein
MPGKKLKPFWERAYKGHAFWLGKQKLGRVTLAAQGRYTWEAAGKAGASDDLDKAKKAVELAVAVADKQLDLFD